MSLKRLRVVGQVGNVVRHDRRHVLALAAEDLVGLSNVICMILSYILFFNALRRLATQGICLKFRIPATNAFNKITFFN